MALLTPDYTQLQNDGNWTKLMVVQEEGAEDGKVYVAADAVGAGIGEQVLVVSGSTARKVFGSDDVPADMAIVGIIDTVEMQRSGY